MNEAFPYFLGGGGGVGVIKNLIEKRSKSLGKIIIDDKILEQNKESTSSPRASIIFHFLNPNSCSIISPNPSPRKTYFHLKTIFKKATENRSTLFRFVIKYMI
jgi:hypothetical protein